MRLSGLQVRPSLLSLHYQGRTERWWPGNALSSHLRAQAEWPDGLPGLQWGGSHVRKQLPQSIASVATFVRDLLMYYSTKTGDYSAVQMLNRTI
jgi:hypothetical protein